MGDTFFQSYHVFATWIRKTKILYTWYFFDRPFNWKEKKHIFKLLSFKSIIILTIAFFWDVFNKNVVLLILIRLYSKDWNDIFQRFHLIKVSQNINKRF